MATKDDMGKFKTAMEARFDAMSKRLEAMEATMQSLFMPLIGRGIGHTPLHAKSDRSPRASKTPMPI